MSKTPLEKLQDLSDIQCQDGNWNYDPYMHGLANGMLLAIHILEDAKDNSSPLYKDAPKHWLSDFDTLEKFNKSGVVIK